MDDRMGHGYMIRTGDYHDNTRITGWGKSVDGSVKSSLRAEHCGAISILIIILIMEKMSDSEIGGVVELYIDNLTVVNRLKEESVLNDETTDNDLWRFTLTLMGEISSRLMFYHVNAHQDLIIGPMS